MLFLPAHTVVPTPRVVVLLAWTFQLDCNESAVPFFCLDLASLPTPLDPLIAISRLPHPSPCVPPLKTARLDISTQVAGAKGKGAKKDRSYEPDQVFFFLDLFAVRQAYDQAGCGIHNHHMVPDYQFAFAIRKAEIFAMACDPWFDPMFLRRSWCMHEVSLAESACDERFRWFPSFLFGNKGKGRSQVEEENGLKARGCTG